MATTQAPSKNDRIHHHVFGEGIIVGLRDFGTKVTCDMDNPPDDGQGQRRVFPVDDVVLVVNDRLSFASLAAERSSDGGIDLFVGENVASLTASEAAQLASWIAPAEPATKTAQSATRGLNEDFEALGRKARGLFTGIMDEVLNPNWGKDQPSERD